jgi:hypothetical protein
MAQNNLTPKEQTALFELLKKSGQQPMSGGMDQSVVDPGAQMNMPAPGSFADNPQVAMQAISQILMQKASGPQLTQGDNGFEAKVQSTNPLKKLFGMKDTIPVKGANYFDSLSSALGPDETAKLLPEGVARTPAGKPFIGEKTADQILQMSDKTKQNRTLSPEESKLTIAYWKEAAPALVPMAEAIMEKSGGLPEWLGKAGPSYRLKRSEYSSVQGFTEDGKPVEYDQTERKWFVGGKETPADQVGRLLTKNRPQMSNEQINEVTNLLNAQTQLKEVKNLFDPNATGPIQDKLYKFQKATGIQLPDLHGMSAMSDNKVQLRTILGSSINDYIKAITGAQMSEPEARRIMSVLPDPGASDEAFLPALNEIMRITDKKLTNRLDVLETQDTVGIKKLRELNASTINPATGEPSPRALPPQKKKSLNDIFGNK